MNQKIYYLYHIPGKKIGVTKNPLERITLQQGYLPNEYQILYKTDDIDKISEMEIKMQELYGYKVDRQKYNQLTNKNKMNLNITEQTTTFACPLNKLRGNLIDQVGMVWETDLGEFKITNESLRWILANAKTSMFNQERCFIYNKAFYEAFNNEEHNPDSKFYKDNEENVFDLIRDWAKERDIYKRGNSNTQYIKLMEEAGELAQALLKRNDAEIYDAIGDMVVVLTNLAELEGVRIEDCICDAYTEISTRKGEMINGTFVKNTL